MDTFVRRLNSLLSLTRESWTQRRKSKTRRSRPAASTRTRLSLEALEDRMLLSSNLPTTAPPAQLAVVASADATAGQKTSVTVEALDANGKALSNFTGAIQLISSDAKANLPSTYTFKASDHGIHTFKAVLDTAGTESITAADGAVSGTASILVAPGAAHKFSVSSSSSTTVDQLTPLTVAALDAHGNVAAGYTGTVHFSSSDPKAQLPANYTFTVADQGSHTFFVILDTAGKDSVKVTETANGAIVGQAKLKVSSTRFLTEDKSTPASGQSIQLIDYGSSGKQTSVYDYTLSNGVLSLNGKQIETNVAAFAVGAASPTAKVGYVIYYVTTDGDLFQVGGDGNALASGVSYLTASTAGQVFYLETPQTLTGGPASGGGDLYALGVGLIRSGVTALAAGQSTAYYVTVDGNLFQVGNDSNALASSVTSLAATTSGNIYYLTNDSTTDSDLYAVGGGLISSGVTTLAADKNAYYLTVSGELYQIGNISPLASGVAALTTADDNTYYLTKGGDVLEVGVNSVQASGAVSLAGAGDNVYYLTGTGDLYMVGEAPRANASQLAQYRPLDGAMG